MNICGVNIFIIYFKNFYLNYQFNFLEVVYGNIYYFYMFMFDM